MWIFKALAWQILDEQLICHLQKEQWREGQCLIHFCTPSSVGLIYLIHSLLKIFTEEKNIPSQSCRMKRKRHWYQAQGSGRIFLIPRVKENVTDNDQSHFFWIVRDASIVVNDTCDDRYSPKTFPVLYPGMLFLAYIVFRIKIWF